MNKRLILTQILIGITFTWLLTSCGAELSPEQTAERFLKAIKTGDKVQAKKFVIEAHKKQVDQWVPIIMGDPKEIEILKSIPEGDEIIILYKDMGIAKELHLVKEKGKWKAKFDPLSLPPLHNSKIPDRQQV